MAVSCKVSSPLSDHRGSVRHVCMSTKQKTKPDREQSRLRASSAERVTGAQSSREQHDKRRAAALRENLRKRKEQAEQRRADTKKDKE